MFCLKFSDEQNNIRKMVAEFAAKELAPGAAARDESESFEEAYRIMMDKMKNLDLLGLPYPKEYGGAGADTVSFVLSNIEISKVDASLGCAYAVHIGLACWPIFQYGTEAQKHKYASPMFKGEKLGAFALTEPNAGSDSGAQETTAVLVGDEYVLNGRKCFITNAGYADVYVVFAMTDKSKGAKGISAFIVEKDTPGFIFGKQERKMGIRSTIQRELIFENCRIPKENLLGKEGEGFKIAMTTLDGGRIGIASQGVGIALGAYEYALNYAKHRVQFGKPIIQQQVISFKLADMYTQIEAARLLTLQAAYYKDAGLNYSLAAAMAKKYATNTAMYVTTEAVQILGGHGYLRDHPVERMMRDAKITQIYEGTNEIQNLVIGGAIIR